MLIACSVLLFVFSVNYHIIMSDLVSHDWLLYLIPPSFNLFCILLAALTFCMSSVLFLTCSACYLTFTQRCILYVTTIQTFSCSLFCFCFAFLSVFYFVGLFNVFILFSLHNLHANTFVFSCDILTDAHIFSLNNYTL